MNQYELDWPSYQAFPYERDLAKSEVVALTGGSAEACDRRLSLLTFQPIEPAILERIAFASRLRTAGDSKDTQIARLERSALRARFGSASTFRKESNYLTHGLHRYKGKFYPQLARSLLNISGARRGDLVLDPFMGSGTTLLESWLMGLDSLGFDINPLAQLIARTKVSSLRVGPQKLRTAVESYEQYVRSLAVELRIDWRGGGSREGAGPCRVTAKELASAVGRPLAEREFRTWFPGPVIEKLFLALRGLEALQDAVARDFIRVCISDILRGVSQQEPRDLRIRRRSVPIDDAPVLTLLFEKLNLELSKIEAGAELLSEIGPRPDSWAELADVRHTRRHHLLQVRSVDAVVSSPPYATALPYVDTGRLSYLVLGLASPSERNNLQRELIGTREITERERRSLEREMTSPEGLSYLPRAVGDDLRHVLKANSTHSVGFRRRNTPALLFQYFRGMQAAMQRVASFCRPEAAMLLVLGDSKTTLGTGEVFNIRTCDHVAAICEHVGFNLERRIGITVTTEDLAHAKNAITTNEILVFRRD